MLSGWTSASTLRTTTSYPWPITVFRWSASASGTDTSSLGIAGTSTTTTRPGRCGASTALQILLLRRHDGEHAHRTPAALGNLERRGNEDRPGRWQPIQVAEACEPELARAVHEVVVGEGRIETSSLSRIGADGFDPDPEHVAIDGEEARRARIEPWTVRTVRRDVDHAGRPNEARCRDRVARVVWQILAGDPMNGRIEVGAGVLAEAQRVP